jgi:hypothetical protein
MKMWNLLSVKTRKITVALATEFAEMEAAPGDRPLSERRMQVYERLLREGSFRPCVWSTATCEETGGRYRVNGKHTSILFSRLANEFPDHYVNVETYACNTLEDVGRLYGTFDAQITSRTSSDINLAFASTVPELRGIPRHVLNVCVTGIALHLADGSRNRIYATPCQRAELLLEYPEFVLWTNDIISTRKHRHLQRGGVVGAMFATRSKCKRDAEKFWLAVRDETGTTPNCPDRLLSRWLLTTVVVPDSGRKVASKQADIREFYVRCLHAWNAWRKNVELGHLKYNPASKPPSLV